jgi:mono/diheme cytochrome c family protein
MTTPLGAALLVAPLAVLAPRAAAAQEAAAGALPGKVTYDRWCAGCHGAEGKGDGPGAARMLPRPRDFTRAQYQIRTTGSGELPTDADILHVINVGMPGTAMPGWEEILSDVERENLVTYLKSLSRFFEGAPAPTVMDFTTRRVAATSASPRAARSTSSCNARSVTGTRAAPRALRRRRSTTTSASRSTRPISSTTGSSTAAARSRTSTVASARGWTARPCPRSTTCWSPIS